eukprot:3190731-Amphidinium_carterae.2
METCLLITHEFAATAFSHRFSCNEVLHSSLSSGHAVPGWLAMHVWAPAKTVALGWELLSAARSRSMDDSCAFACDSRSSAFLTF